MLEAFQTFVTRHARPGVAEIGVRRESDLVGDALMSELDAQIREAVEREKQTKRNSSQGSTAPDYSWLIAKRTENHYRLPQLRRFEIESLCREVREDEVGQVMSEFQRQVGDCTPTEEIVNIFTHVLQTHVKEMMLRRANAMDTNTGTAKQHTALAKRSSTRAGMERRTSFPSGRSMRSSRIAPIQDATCNNQQPL